MYIKKNILYFLSTFIILIFIIAPTIVFAEFKIVYPKSNSTVRGEVVEIEGEGAVAGDTIEISVLTNDWYIQDGKAEIGADGKWSYAPCYLSGKGKFNYHSIKAKLIRNGNAVDQNTVRGVVRE